MWEVVEMELARLLESRIYKALLGDRSEWGDVGYLRECLKRGVAVLDAGRRPRMYPGFLFRAGILPEFPTKVEQLIPAQKEKLREAARMEARLIVGGLEGLGALRELRATAEVVSGRRLYRMWDSRYASSEAGVWWFSEGLYAQVKGLPAAERREVLRDYLAVSRDWSNLDRVSCLNLGAQELPAIVALGLPQRYYSKGMWQQFGVVETSDEVEKRRAYYANLQRVLGGGKTQFYLPWVPKYLVSLEAILAD